uniref:uncharacterized protein LOC109953028 n=1 Tax=Monopterus albus TaxID=43700 RepID=UPI0009B35E2F|nr:uncharacterized protein LOC109953028 [Monopterus albus]
MKLFSHREKMMWILLLFILTSSVWGTVVLKMTQTFYQTEENNSISIRWDTENKTDLSLINLVCFLSEGLKCLFDMRNGVEVPESQHQQFAGRVHLDKDALRDGRVTLHLSRVTAEDSGSYWCELAADYDQVKRRWTLLTSGKSTLLLLEVRTENKVMELREDSDASSVYSSLIDMDHGSKHALRNVISITSDSTVVLTGKSGGLTARLIKDVPDI